MSHEYEDFNLRLRSDYAAALLNLSSRLGCSRQELIAAVLENSVLTDYVLAQESVVSDLKKLLPERAIPLEQKTKALILDPVAPPQTDSSVPVARLGGWLVRVVDKEIQLVVQVTRAGVVPRAALMAAYCHELDPIDAKPTDIHPLPIERFKEVRDEQSGWLCRGEVSYNTDGEIRKLSREEPGIPVTPFLGQESNMPYLGYWIYHSATTTLYVCIQGPQSHSDTVTKIKSGLPHSCGDRPWSRDVRKIIERTKDEMNSMLSVSIHSERGEYYKPKDAEFSFVKYPSEAAEKTTVSRSTFLCVSDDLWKVTELEGRPSSSLASFGDWRMTSTASGHGILKLEVLSSGYVEPDRVMERYNGELQPIDQRARDIEFVSPGRFGEIRKYRDGHYLGRVTMNALGQIGSFMRARPSALERGEWMGHWVYSGPQKTLHVFFRELSKAETATNTLKDAIRVSHGQRPWEGDVDEVYLQSPSTLNDHLRQYPDSPHGEFYSVDHRTFSFSKYA